MSFLYPRIGQLHRDPARTGAGPQPYGGARASERLAIGQPFRCSVQAKGSGRTGEAGLPADTRRAEWVVMVPRAVVSAMAPERFRDGDIIIDDLGRVFRVTSDFIDSLGGAIMCEREKV